MPYIKQEQRPHLDEAVNMVLNRLLLRGDTLKTVVDPGELNYVVSSILWKLWNVKQSYSNGSMLCNVLSDVQHEFRRRKFDKYEDLKIEENGDLV